MAWSHPSGHDAATQVTQTQSEDAMKRQLIGLAAIAALVLAGCSQDTGQSATPAGPAAPTTAAATSSSTLNDSATVTITR